MKINERGVVQYAALLGVGVLAAGLVFLSSSLTKFNGNTNTGAQVLSEATTEFVLASGSSIANQDGNTVTTGASKAWVGTGQSTSQSLLGMHFTGGVIPANAEIKSASLEFTAVGGWISLSFAVYGDTSTGGVFSNSSKPSSRPLTSASKGYSDNVKWDANKVYSHDVTAPVKELVGSQEKVALTLIAKGAGSQYGRKEIYGNPSTGKSPKLKVTYTTSVSSTGSATATPVATPTATATASVSPSASSTPRATVVPVGSPLSTAQATTRATATPTVTATPVATMTPVASPVAGTIFGLVSSDLLGTCSEEVHNRYVVVGPDGNTYRSYHPQTVPVDANNPNGAKCTFAHEHGDDPASSKIYAGKQIAFGYAAYKMAEPKDEPHAGFKCFVHNSGTRNDEWTVALNDSYTCFHMGTGGPSRFTARFHSAEYHVKAPNGSLMRVVGMADTGNVGTICNEPRQQRTVQGFGCRLGSSYEIWEDILRITNRGNIVATAVISTAVFDPITSMDPADMSRTVYSWSPEAQSKIYEFVEDRSYYRGCDRESYSGPYTWYNSSGVTTYYTDAYGNVQDNGPLVQTISRNNGNLIMGYKGGETSDPQNAFKLRRSSCGPGLGLKN